MAEPSSHLTRVELIWVAKKTEYWIRFGTPDHELLVDRTRRILSFSPGKVFALVRWKANDYGTVLSRLDVLRSVDRDEPFQTLSSITPGAEILLTVSGWKKVERVLNHIDAMEAFDIEAEEVAPDHWHHVHNRIRIGETPAPYTRARHSAWLQRRKVNGGEAGR